MHNYMLENNVGGTPTRPVSRFRLDRCHRPKIHRNTFITHHESKEISLTYISRYYFTNIEMRCSNLATKYIEPNVQIVFSQTNTHYVMASKSVAHIIGDTAYRNNVLIILTVM